MAMGQFVHFLFDHRNTSILDSDTRQDLSQLRKSLRQSLLTFLEVPDIVFNNVNIASHRPDEGHDCTHDRYDREDIAKAHFVLNCWKHRKWGLSPPLSITPEAVQQGCPHAEY